MIKRNRREITQMPQIYYQNKNFEYRYTYLFDGSAQKFRSRRRTY